MAKMKVASDDLVEGEGHACDIAFLTVAALPMLFTASEIKDLEIVLLRVNQEVSGTKVAVHHTQIEVEIVDHLEKIKS